MSFFGRIFGSKRQLEEDKDRRHHEEVMAAQRQADRDHRADDRKEEDIVAYQNHMNPANRAAAVIGAIGNAGAQLGGAAAGIMGVAGGASPFMAGLGSMGAPGAGAVPHQPSTGGGDINSMLKNPMVLLGGAALLFILLKKK